MARIYTFEQRFWMKVAKGPTCWLWTGSLTPDGYGRFVVSNSPPRIRGAHRVSWQLAHGDIPVGLSVLHRCDTPACVNPEHLFLGTQADNVADMIGKGRWRGHSPTECPAGHPYDEANTRYERNRSGGLSRKCRACDRTRRQRYLDRKGRITTEERAQQMRHIMHIRWHEKRGIIKPDCEFCNMQ